MVEIRFHGRGGQGTVVASKILADAVSREDKAHHPDTVEHGIQGYLKRKAILDDILAKGEPYAISHLNIDGNDLIAFGIPAGPIIGKILRELLNLVIINPNKNNKAFLKSWAINNWRRIRKENEIQ